jgi:hypothetical protein
LALALLLSVGVNLGILAMLALDRLRPEPVSPLGPETPLPGAPGEAAEALRVPLPVLRMADRLGLVGEERRRFVEIQMRFFAATVAERRRLAGLHRELRLELTAAEPDHRRVEALLSEIGRAFAALEGALARNVLDSREVLDAEQERLFLEFVRRLRAGQAGPRPGRGAPWQGSRRPRRERWAPPAGEGARP